MAQNITDILNGIDEDEASTTQASEQAESDSNVAESDTQEANVDAEYSDDDAGDLEAAAAPDEKRTAPVKAVIEERKKRQVAQRKAEELEARLHKLEAQLHASQNQTPQKAAEKDDFDPDAVYSDIPGTLRTMKKKMLEEFRTAQQTERYESSEELAAETYADYGEVRESFLKLCSENNADAIAIARKMHESKIPAVAMYKAMKKHMDAQRWHDPEYRKAQMEAEVNKRVEEELSKMREELDGSREALSNQKPVTSIANARGVGNSKKALSTGHESVRDILGR